MKNGKWEIGASLGAATTLRENASDITEAVLADAEQRAIDRSKRESVRPAIIRLDVEQAITSARKLAIDLDLAFRDANRNPTDSLAYLWGWFENAQKINREVAVEMLAALTGAAKRFNA